MKAIIDAIVALLEGAGLTVYYVDVPEKPAMPYVLLWSSSGRLTAEALCDEQVELDEPIGVTAVAGSAGAVLIVHDTIRPLLHGATPTVVGLSVHLKLWDSQLVQVDRDVTIGTTNRHPATGVDQYWLNSTPAPVG